MSSSKKDFTAWKRQVDQELVKLVSVESDDLPDLLDSYAYFNEGFTPAMFAKELAEIAIEDAGLGPWF